MYAYIRSSMSPPKPSDACEMPRLVITRACVSHYVNKEYIFGMAMIHVIIYVPIYWLFFFFL